jgi:uncharacterized tellurite resistance protein B-like protein
MGYANPSAGKRREDYTEVAVADLAATAGTADNTVADVTATYSQAILNDNFRDLASKINEVLVELRKAGIINP